MNPSTAVLFNSPALNALHRKQLVSLCKRFQIKASGKNADLVVKLQELAKTLPDAAADSADSLITAHIAEDSNRTEESCLAFSKQELGTQPETHSYQSAEDDESVSMHGSETEENQARPSFLEEELSIRMISTRPPADIEMDKEESEVLAAVSPQRQMARIPLMAFAASPIKHLPALNPLSVRSPIPGAFPSSTTHEVQSVSPDQSTCSPSPFIFGSPRHSVRNHAFVVPVINTTTSQAPAASDTRPSSESTSASVGLSVREMMEAELKKRVEEKASKGELVRGPGLLSSLAGISTLGRAEGKKRRFDDAHEKEFAKMTSIADHYAARRPGQTNTLPSSSSISNLQKKPVSQRRPSSTPQRPSLIANSSGRTYRPKGALQLSAEDDPERAVKKTRFSVLEPVQVPNSEVSSETSTTAMQQTEDSKGEQSDKSSKEAEAQRERERTKRKLAIAKARRSSLAAERGGRFSLASITKTLPPKPNTSRLGISQIGMNTVKQGVLSSTKGIFHTTSGPSTSLQSSAEKTLNSVEKSFQTLSSSTKPALSSNSAKSKTESATLPGKATSNASRAPIPTFSASSRSSSIRSGLVASSTPRVPTGGTINISRTPSRLFAPTASSLAKRAGAKALSTELPSSSSSSSLAIRSKDAAVTNLKRPAIPTMKRSPSGLLPEVQEHMHPVASSSTPKSTSIYPTLPFDTASLVPGTFPLPSAPNGSISTPSTNLSKLLGKSPSRSLLKVRSASRLSTLQPRLSGSTPVRKKRSTMSAHSVGKPIGFSHRVIISSSTGPSGSESGSGTGSSSLSGRGTTGRKSRSSLSLSVSAAKARARAQARAHGRISLSSGRMSISDTSMDAGETGGRLDHLS